MNPSQFSALVRGTVTNALEQAKAGRPHYGQRLASTLEKHALVLRAACGGDPLWLYDKKLRAQPTDDHDATVAVLTELGKANVDLDKLAHMYDVALRDVEVLYHTVRRTIEDGHNSIVVGLASGKVDVDLSRLAAHLRQQARDDE